MPCPVPPLPPSHLTSCSCGRPVGSLRASCSCLSVCLSLPSSLSRYCILDVPITHLITTRPISVSTTTTIKTRLNLASPPPPPREAPIELGSPVPAPGCLHPWHHLIRPSAPSTHLIHLYTDTSIQPCIAPSHDHCCYSPCPASDHLIPCAPVVSLPCAITSSWPSSPPPPPISLDPLQQPRCYRPSLCAEQRHHGRLLQEAVRLLLRWYVNPAI